MTSNKAWTPATTVKTVASNRKLITIFGAAMLLLFCCIAQPLLGAEKYAVTSTTLNVRSGAGGAYSKIGSLAQNETVEVLEISNNWAKIQYKDRTGYVSMDYLSKVSEAESISEQSDSDEEREIVLATVLGIFGTVLQILFLILLFTKVDTGAMRWKFVYIYVIFPFLYFFLAAGSFKLWMLILFLIVLGFYCKHIYTCFVWTRKTYSTGAAYWITLFPVLVVTSGITYAIVEYGGKAADTVGSWHFTWTPENIIALSVLGVTILSFILTGIFSQYKLTIRFITIYIAAILAFIFIMSNPDTPNPYQTGVLNKHFWNVFLIYLLATGVVGCIIYYIAFCFNEVRYEKNIFVAIVSVAFPAIVIGIVSVLLIITIIAMLIPIGIIIAMALGKGSGSTSSVTKVGSFRTVCARCYWNQNSHCANHDSEYYGNGTDNDSTHIKCNKHL